MNRYLFQTLEEFLGRKPLLLMGPRQVGKTTLAKSLNPSFAYYNYDIKADARVFQKQEWDESKTILIFDELHKMRKWKLWLKGLYDDGRLKKQPTLVTGSARLDIAKNMGDSLAGRFFSFRLHPFDLKEAKKFSAGSLEQIYSRLISVGNFPEPFLENSDRFAALWRKTHSDVILRQDLISLEQVRDLEGIELLVELLANRVGSTISFNSLAEDLDRDDKTVKRWVTLLENLYIVFRVQPQTSNIARALKKACKFYFYDLGKVEGGEAQKLENAVALALKKEIEFQEDSQGTPGNLTYLRTKDGLEIDFLVQQKKRTPKYIEVKLSDGEPSRSFESLLKSQKGPVEKIQLVKNLAREFTSKNGVRVCSALHFMQDLDLSH